MTATASPHRLEQFWHWLTRYELIEWRYPGVSRTDLAERIKVLKFSGRTITVDFRQAGSSMEVDIQIIHGRRAFYSVRLNAAFIESGGTSVLRGATWFSVWGYLQEIVYTALTVWFAGMIYRESPEYALWPGLLAAAGIIFLMHLFFRSLRIRDKNQLVEFITD